MSKADPQGEAEYEIEKAIAVAGSIDGVDMCKLAKLLVREALDMTYQSGLVKGRVEQSQ